MRITVKKERNIAKGIVEIMKTELFNKKMQENIRISGLFGIFLLKSPMISKIIREILKIMKKIMEFVNKSPNSFMKEI